MAVKPLQRSSQVTTLARRLFFLPIMQETVLCLTVKEVVHCSNRPIMAAPGHPLAIPPGVSSPWRSRLPLPLITRSGRALSPRGCSAPATAAQPGSLLPMGCLVTRASRRSPSLRLMRVMDCCWLGPAAGCTVPPTRETCGQPARPGSWGWSSTRWRRPPAWPRAARSLQVPAWDCSDLPMAPSHGSPCKKTDSSWVPW